ncbi:rhomboid family intramembrane serine protease [Woodsholea maritima]|uniref:rhomboid family intramembrane serine protease n=1 Tax=Woodsholea maritima TaxID=240237 RepID=UPI0003771B7F|nr:rhomboid family intramembrane serine protease [Woodsholea maritima]
MEKDPREDAPAGEFGPHETGPYSHKPGPEGDPWQARRVRRPRLGGPIFNNIPLTILALVALMIAVFALDSLVPSLHGVFWIWGAVVTGPYMDLVPNAPLGGLPPYLLHVFLHGGLMHIVMNAFALLAFGAAAMRPFRPGPMGVIGFLSFFFICALGGSVFHLLTHLNTPTVMVGASTAVSGVLAAAGYAGGGREGMMRLALPWLGINLVFAGLDLFMDFPIAWAGHIGGLAAGAILYPFWLKMYGRQLPPHQP